MSGSCSHWQFPSVVFPGWQSEGFYRHPSHLVLQSTIRSGRHRILESELRPYSVHSVSQRRESRHTRSPELCFMSALLTLKRTRTQLSWLHCSTVLSIVFCWYSVCPSLNVLRTWANHQGAWVMVGDGWRSCRPLITFRLWGFSKSSIMEMWDISGHKSPET